jgi:hypothetical protein
LRELPGECSSIAQGYIPVTSLGRAHGISFITLLSNTNEVVYFSIQDLFVYLASVSCENWAQIPVQGYFTVDSGRHAM